MAANVASNHFCITKWRSINPTQNKGNNEEAADCRARRSKRRRWLASVPKARQCSRAPAKARHACRLCLPLMLAKGQHSLVHSTTGSPIPSAKARCLLPSRPLDAKYFLYTPSAPTTPRRLASRRLSSRLVTGEMSESAGASKSNARCRTTLSAFSGLPRAGVRGFGLTGAAGCGLVVDAPVALLKVSAGEWRRPVRVRRRLVREWRRRWCRRCSAGSE